MGETGSSSAGDGKHDWAQVDDDTWAALALRLRGIGNAIDARYRYQRLLYAPMGPWQVTLAAVAAAIPPAAGGLLNWALFERSVAARAVAIYFIVAGLEAAVVWFALPFLSIGRFVERRAERLRVRLHTTLCRGGALHGGREG